MARRKRKLRTRRKSDWRRKLIIVLVLVALGGALWLWHYARHWRPDETRYAEQGALIGDEDGAVRFDVLKGLGAQFVYLEASQGANGKETRFSENLAAARAAGLQVGAVHVFDACQKAGGQSANFVTEVPRDPKLLPPAVILSGNTDYCPERVSEAAVQSELMTFVNQIEAHSGKPVILAPTRAFEARYHVAARLDRNLWLSRDFFPPTYAGRPWVLWTANGDYQTPAADHPLRWVVVQP